MAIPLIIHLTNRFVKSNVCHFLAQWINQFAKLLSHNLCSCTNTHPNVVFLRQTESSLVYYGCFHVAWGCYWFL